MNLRLALRGRLAAAALLLVFAATPARANAILDFGTGLAGAGGTVSFAGGLADLIGRNIRIGALTSYDTPQNVGTIVVSGNTRSYGVLNFRTGAYQGFWNNQYNFGPGGYFEITGNVLAAGVTGAEAGQSGLGDGAMLLSGTFSSATISAGRRTSMFAPTGFDTKNAHLLNYFGLASDTLFALSGYSIQAGSVPGNGASFTVNAFSTDIANTAEVVNTAQVVPEPASLLLLGSGLTALATAMRRRRPGQRQGS